MGGPMAQLSENALYKKLETSAHRHFCTNRECRRVFRCIAVACLSRCDHVRTGTLCTGCRGLPISTLDDNWQPRECCRNNVRQVTDRNEALSYQCAGPGPWYRCMTCSRCTGWPLGFNPNDPTTTGEPDE